MCDYTVYNQTVNWVTKSCQTFLFSLMSQSLKYCIPWHTGQLSSINTLAKIDMLINRSITWNWWRCCCTLTDNDAGGSISMTMIFELHAVDDNDEYNLSRYFSIFKIVFINNILHLQISFIVHIIFPLLLPVILSLVGIILLTLRFCTTTSITTFSLSLFWVIFIRSSQM